MTETTKSGIIEMAEDRMYSSKYINAGIERKVVAKDWEKDGKSRTYIKINCYSLAGNYKGSYDCGYWDNVASEYVAPTRHGGYDIVGDDII